LLAVALVVSGAIGLVVGRSFHHTTAVPGVVFRQPVASPSSPNDNLGSSIQAIANKVDKSVVDIDTTLGYQRAQAAGTGMVLTSNGEVLTNNHVIDGATTITATDVTTGKTYAAKVVGVDPTADVAVIQLQGASGLVPISTSDTVSLGSSVIAIGNAGGQGGTPSVVTGTVQATDQSITASDPGGGNAEQLTGMIETNAPIQPGDSGGPLVDTSGQVIGMDTAASASGRFTQQPTVGFAIPISRAISVAQQIESGHGSATVQIGLPGFMGVEVQNANGGAVIAGVVSGSPAANAGIAAGDTITAIDGTSIGSAQDLTTILHTKHPGDKVSVTWTDGNGKSHTATVKLTTGPAA
jgi:S1-C subfamily serine protease